MSLCMNTCVGYTCSRVCACCGAHTCRSWQWMSAVFLCCSPHSSLRQGLSLELISLVRWQKWCNYGAHVWTDENGEAPPSSTVSSTGHTEGKTRTKQDSVPTRLASAWQRRYWRSMMSPSEEGWARWKQSLSRTQALREGTRAACTESWGPSLSVPRLQLSRPSSLFPPPSWDLVIFIVLLIF